MKKSIKIILIMFLTICLSMSMVWAENETGTEGTEGTGGTTGGESTTGGENTTESGNTTGGGSTESGGGNTTGGGESAGTGTETPTPEEPKQEETPIQEPTPKQEEKTKEEDTSSSTKITKNNNDTNTNNTKPQTIVKSNNADLGNLGITPYDFSGFMASKTSYSVSVPYTVKSVEVYAKAKDGNATISGTGNIELKEGKNTATVEVTAEDGTKKTYTIVITRLKEGEKLSAPKLSTGVALASLKVEGLELDSQFVSDKYQYSVNYEGEETSLKITAEADSSSNIVQIIGNENLVDGENIVNILVSDADEENSRIVGDCNRNFIIYRILQFFFRHHYLLCQIF